MDWETYCRIYNNHLLMVYQTRILTIVGRDVFKEFPRKEVLPPNLHRQMKTGIQLAKEDLEELLAAKEAGTIPFETGSKMKGEGELFAYWMMAATASVQLGIFPQWDLQNLIYSQELIMSFAHLDAFMGDSLPAICHVCPDVLKSNKKIDWDTVLSCGGWEELLNHFIEQYVYEIGWKSIQNWIKFLKKELGLTIDFPESDIRLLQEAQQVRHILIHNGGKISQEFITKTGRNDLVIGESFKITPEYAREISFAILALASEIFENVSRKFFTIEDALIKQQRVKFTKKVKDESN